MMEAATVMGASSAASPDATGSQPHSRQRSASAAASAAR